MGTSTEDLSARAKQLIAERRYQEAVRACRRILLSRPAMTEVRILLGMALLALSRHDEVRAEMMAVLRATPEAGPAHRLLGEAHLRDGQVDKARSSFRRALELDPQDLEARELLQEVAGEEPIVSATIDRWFDPEAVATTQTESPEWDDVVTGSLPGFYEDAVGTASDLQGEATIARPPSEAPPAAPESRRPSPPAGPPPRSVPPPPPPRRPAKASSFPPPPPPNSPQRSPGYASPASSIPPPIPAPAFAPDEQTAAQRPQAKVSTDPGAVTTPRPVTDELNLSEVDEIRPPISQSPYHQPASAPGPTADFADDVPTRARASADDDFDADEATSALAPPPELPGEATIARPQDAPGPVFAPGGPADFPSPRPLPTPRSAPPPAFAPGGPADYEPAPAFAPGGPGDYHRSPVPNAAASYPAAGAPPPGGLPPSVATPALAHSPAPGAPARPASTRQRSKGSRILLFGIGILVPLLVGSLAFAGITYWLGARAEDRIDSALVVAEEDGRRSSLDRVLTLVDDHDGSDPEDIALRARLQATLLIEHGATEAAAAADVFLGELEGEELHHRDAIIALTYLALARGDIDRARGGIAQVPLESEPNAELFRAQAVVGSAAADYPAALEASRRALALRPASPRHAALNALLEARGGEIQAALGALGNVPDGSASADVRIARARILKLANSDPNGARTEARVVLEELADTATAPQRGWAHLIEAWHASGHGVPASAIAEGLAARQSRPPGDEEFALDLVEVFVDVGAFQEASDTLGLLPEVSVRRSLRARLEAAVALGNGDVAGAAAALAEAGNEGRASLVRGQVAEAQGANDEAVQHYQNALREDPALNALASARLGMIASQSGNYARVVELLSPVAEQALSNVEVVPVLVDALIREGDTEEAERVVARAIQTPRPDGAAVPASLLVARARLEGARGDWRAALGTLQAVAGREPASADVHRALGEAALHTGSYEVAATAFARVLELATNDGPALAGLALLAVVGGTDLPAMEAAILRAEEAGAEGGFLDQAKARVMVLQGRGFEAVRPLRRLARRSPDPELHIALGQAYRQAFKDTDAARAFSRALAIDEDHPEALLGLAVARSRAGSTRDVADLLARAKTSAESRGLPPSFMARVEAARAGVAYERDDFATASELATAALAIDAECGDAHLYVAAVASQLGRSPVEALRLAVAATPPSVEAMGLLVVELDRGRPSEELCTLGRRYLSAAPRGFDARDVRRSIRSCR